MLYSEIVMNKMRNDNYFDKRLNYYFINAEGDFSLGNYERAIKKYRTVLKYDPINIESRKKLSLCWEEMGYYNKALDQLRYIINNIKVKKTEKINIIFIMLKLYRKDNDIKGQEHCYNMLLHLDNNIIYKIKLIDIYTKKGNDSKAIKICKKMIENNNKKDIALTKLGDIYIKNNKISRAEKYYIRALKCSENNINAKMGLAKIYFAKGNIVKSKKLVMEIISDDRSKKEKELLYESAYILSKIPSTPYYKLLSLLDRSLIIDKKYHEARNLRAKIYLKRAKEDNEFEYDSKRAAHDLCKNAFDKPNERNIKNAISIVMKLRREKKWSDINERLENMLLKQKRISKNKDTVIEAKIIKVDEDLEQTNYIKEIINILNNRKLNKTEWEKAFKLTKKRLQKNPEDISALYIKEIYNIKNGNYIEAEKIDDLLLKTKNKNKIHLIDDSNNFWLDISNKIEYINKTSYSENNKNISKKDLKPVEYSKKDISKLVNMINGNTKEFLTELTIKIKS